jgi:ankyrin repeat protein
MHISKFHDKKLFEAVKSGQLVAAKSALASGANPDISDPSSLMPLVHFCANAKRFDLMRALLEHGADFNQLDKDWRTPIRRCVEDGLYEGVKIFISYRADLTERDSVGDSLLHSACARGRKGMAYFDIAKALIDAGATLIAQNQRREIPLHHAARYGGELMARFIASRSDVNSPDADGHAPIHAAALGMDNEDGVRTLIDANANLDAKDRNAQTALHLIANKPKTRTTDIQVAKLLISSGASTWTRDRDGLTAHDLAAAAFKQRREVHQELVTLLKPKGAEPPPPPPKDPSSGQPGKSKDKR